LEPQSITISQSLQEFALRNGLDHAFPAQIRHYCGMSWQFGPHGWLPEEPFPDKMTKPVEDGNDVEFRHQATRTVRMNQDDKLARSDFGMEVARLSLKQSMKANRWWTMLRLPLVCPVSGFPINLLHYPPFKLRERAADPNPHSLVDGKSLALLLLSNGSLNVNGRSLERSEVDALGEHNRRCKVGPYRFNEALNLLSKAQDEGLLENERAEAVNMFSKIQVFASCDLANLQCMQEQRLLQLHDQMTSSVDRGRAKKLHKQESEWSTNSTCASESDSPQLNTMNAFAEVSLSEERNMQPAI